MTHRKGFTLVEVVVVLLIVSIVIGMASRMVAAQKRAQQERAVTYVLQPIDDALTAHAMVQRRLPCPADGSLPATDPNWGRERRDAGTGDCLDEQRRGVVPWISLGLPEAQAMDGYYGRITYRAAPGLTRDNAMKWSDCDSAGTRAADGAAPYQACAPGCTGNDMSSCTTPLAVLAGRGLGVRDGTGIDLMSPGATGAAYVLVSHGANRAGSYGASGALQEAQGTIGAGETINSAEAPLAAFYHDELVNATDTPAHFDDVLSRPTMTTVVARAHLAPRVH